MSIPANTIDWPVRCENVLIKVYGIQYIRPWISLKIVAEDIDDDPQQFLRHRNFGRKSLQQMREIIEREMGDAG